MASETAERRRSRSRSMDRREESSHEKMLSNRSPETEHRPASGERAKSSEAGHDPTKERRRPTWFDIGPVAGAPPPISDLPGAVKVIPESLPGNLAASAQAGAANQQATRHARRIYVGGLPPHAKEGDIATFFRFVNLALCFFST